MFILYNGYYQPSTLTLEPLTHVQAVCSSLHYAGFLYDYVGRSVGKLVDFFIFLTPVK